MMTLEEIGRFASGLPEVTERLRWGNRTWCVDDKGFAWERPFTRADIKRFGNAEPPPGEILAVRVSDLGEKEAIIATCPEAVFTIPHFDHYAAVLIRLQRAKEEEVIELVVDGWLSCAPRRLVSPFLERRSPS